MVGQSKGLYRGVEMRSNPKPIPMDTAWNKYEQLFGEQPPVFGYDEEDILPAINKAIETNTPMPGMDEVIEKELGMTEKDRSDGKSIIL